MTWLNIKPVIPHRLWLKSWKIKHFLDVIWPKTHDVHMVIFRVLCDVQVSPPQEGSKILSSENGCIALAL